MTTANTANTASKPSKASKGSKATTEQPLTTEQVVSSMFKPGEHVSVTPAGDNSGNGGQLRNNVSLYGVSVSSLIRGLTQAGCYPATLIMAMLAAAKLPVSPDTVKTQRNHARKGTAKLVEYAELNAPLRDACEALAAALCNDDAATPGTVSKLAKQLATLHKAGSTASTSYRFTPPARS